MKTVEQIANTPNLLIVENNEFGGIGQVEFWKFRGTVVWGRAEGGQYDHVSVSSPKRIPTWEELCKIKDMFFDDEEECYQVFPKKSEYVNIHKNCMHIWRNVEAASVDNTERNM